MKTPAVLMVVPNNTGFPSDDQASHDGSARDDAVWWSRDSTLSNLQCPILVPTFPRPGGDRYGYTHALDRQTLITKVPNLARLDLQLLAMIEDARARLAARKIVIDPKVWMFGFSASGSFVSRFTALHPEVVKAASVGAPFICPILPVPQWNGVRLPYMVGVADLQDLVGKPFDAAGFKQVPQLVYIGADEVAEDAVSATTPYDTEGAYKLVRDVFGATDVQYAAFEAVYNSIGAASRVMVFPGVRHTYIDYRYYLEFFERYRAASPPPAPKPLLYKLYFPHVSASGDWETVVTLVNTAPGVPIRGELQGYHAEGGSPVQSVALTVPGAGRRQIVASQAFSNPQAISYLVFLSDSAFISGEAALLFKPLGGRAFVPAVRGAQRGSFLPMDSQSWSGIGLVNIEDGPATVYISAQDDLGSEIASRNLNLEPGAKMFGEPGGILGADLPAATHVWFSSNRKLAGMALNVSEGGAVLEALPALPDYLR